MAVVQSGFSCAIARDQLNDAASTGMTAFQKVITLPWYALRTSVEPIGGSAHLDADARWHAGRTGQVVECPMWNTMRGVAVRVIGLEHEHLVGPHIRVMRPALIGIVPQEERLKREHDGIVVIEDRIRGDEILSAQASRITDRKRYILRWRRQDTPYVVLGRSAYRAPIIRT